MGFFSSPHRSPQYITVIYIQYTVHCICSEKMHEVLYSRLNSLSWEEAETAVILDDDVS